MKLFTNRYLIAIAAIFMLLGCKGPTRPVYPQSFVFQYREQGGYAGVSNLLEITRDDSLVYRGGDFRAARKLRSAERKLIYDMLEDYHFFALHPIYVPEIIVKDDIQYTLTYSSPSEYKQIVASGSCGAGYDDCSWPSALGVMVNFFQSLIQNIEKSTTTGCTNISKRYQVAGWPYGKEISLGVVYKYHAVEISDTLYRVLRQAEEQTPPILFYEGDYLYRMNPGIQYNTPQNDMDTVLTVHDRAKPIRWKLAPAIDEFPVSGIQVNGEDYFWLNTIFSEQRYPRYFMDKDLADGNFAYQLTFVRGNLCGEYASKSFLY